MSPELSTSFHSVLQDPNPPPPEKLPSPPKREPPSPGDCNIPNPPEFRHLKLVEIPIATVLFLMRAWLNESLTHLLTQLMGYMRLPLELLLKTTSQLFINYLPWANRSVFTIKKYPETFNWNLQGSSWYFWEQSERIICEKRKYHKLAV